jgi:hypothetical protein
MLYYRPAVSYPTAIDQDSSTAPYRGTLQTCLLMSTRQTLSQSVFLGFLVLSAVPAGATVLTFAQCTPSIANVSLGSPATGTITCPQFDPSLGALQFYIVSMPPSAPDGASATFFNSNSTPFTSNLLVVDQVRVAFQLPGSPLLEVYPLAASNPNGFTIPANSSITVPLNSFSGGTSSRAVMPLSLVTGTGTFSFNYTVEIVNTNLMPGVTATAASINNWNIAARPVGFQFEPVPEPSSAVLFGSALGIAALIRRLRR